MTAAVTILLTIAAGWFAKMNLEEPHIRFCPVIFAFLAGGSWGVLFSALL